MENPEISGISATPTRGIYWDGIIQKVLIGLFVLKKKLRKSAGSLAPSDG